MSDRDLRAHARAAALGDPLARERMRAGERRSGADPATLAVVERALLRWAHTRPRALRIAIVVATAEIAERVGALLWLMSDVWDVDGQDDAMQFVTAEVWSERLDADMRSRRPLRDWLALFHYSAEPSRPALWHADA